MEKVKELGKTTEQGCFNIFGGFMSKFFGYFIVVCGFIKLIIIIYEASRNPLWFFAAMLFLGVIYSFLYIIVKAVKAVVKS